jgi:drug/metabolite transporter (DMT)-like permease
MDLGQSRSGASEQNGTGQKVPDIPALQGTAAKLSQDIAYLQSVKEQLENEVDSLKEQYRSLQLALQSARNSHSVPLAKPIPLEFGAAPLPVQLRESQLPLGLWLVLLSAIALSVHYVVVKLVFGVSSPLFGWINLGGGFQPSLGNVFLLIWTRMLVVVPVMALCAGFLYPPVWQDVKRLVLDRDRRPLWNVISSGGFLFLSQVLIYLAIAKIGPSAAVTILFMYPLFTLPLTWWLFGDRPSPLRIGMCLVILLGVMLTAIPSLITGGVWLAVSAGAAFAFYLIFMQLGFKKLHPVPVSMVQFITALFLASFSLALPLQLGVSVPPESRMGFLNGGLLLGGLTIVGYLANNFGVQYFGAARSSVLAATGPVLTMIVAALLLQDSIQQSQVMGVLGVTVGAIALSFERMRQISAANRMAK